MTRTKSASATLFADILHREQMPIRGFGQISLGVSFDEDPEEIIELTTNS